MVLPQPRTFGRIQAVFCFIVGLGVLLLLAYLVASGGPALKIEDRRGDATVSFSADQSWVLLPTGCTTIHWAVDGILEVYLNGQGTVGEGEVSFCLSTGQPNLRVHYRSKGSILYYILPIQILVYQSTFWALVAACLISFLLAGYFLPVHVVRAVLNRISQLRQLSRLKIVRWVGYAFAILLVIMICSEVALRAYFTYFAGEDDRKTYLYSSAEIEKTNAFFIPLPYVMYGLNPTYPGHNSLGYRGKEIMIPKPNDTFRIVAIGSSITYGNFLSLEDTYPAQLQKILNDEGYPNVEVINAGVAGYTSWEYLANLEYRILDLQPDMIIVYESTNDISLRLIDPVYYNGLNPSREWDSSVHELPESVLYRFLGIQFKWMPDPDRREDRTILPSYIRTCLYDQPFCKSLNMSKHDLLQVNKPIYYERNIRNMIGIAKANGIQTLLVSWAYFPDPLPNTPEQYMVQPERQEAVAEHNDILRQLGVELDVPFYDLEGNLPYNLAFWLDGRHFSAEGAHEAASELAKFIVDDNLLPSR